MTPSESSPEGSGADGSSAEDAPTDQNEPSLGSLIPDSATTRQGATTRDASDGRVALRLRNRQRVVEAFIELVEEGDSLPSIDAVVQRSGLSERSIFRYFTDVNELVVAAVRLVLDRAAPLRMVPSIGEGSLDHRIDEVISARLRFYDRVHPFARISRLKLSTSAEIQQGQTNLVRLMKQQFRVHFAPEFDQMTAEHATAVIDVLVTLMTFEGVDVVIHQLENDQDGAAHRWRVAMTALLTAPPLPPERVSATVSS